MRRGLDKLYLEWVVEGGGQLWASSDHPTAGLHWRRSTSKKRFCRIIHLGLSILHLRQLSRDFLEKLIFTQLVSTSSTGSKSGPTLSEAVIFHCLRHEWHFIVWYSVHSFKTHNFASKSKHMKDAIIEELYSMHAKILLVSAYTYTLTTVLKSCLS